MHFEIRPMTPQERIYSYTQSQQLIVQTGCIGHLRADMDTGGEGFFTRWDDHCENLKTQAFKAELDEVIHALRFDEQYGGILKNRSLLAAYCYSHPESSFGGDGRSFGFRADSGQHTYMLRLNPNKGEYNLYCYCYRRDRLDQHMKRAQKGIRFITPAYKELFRIPDGDKIRITSPTGEQRDRVCRYIDEAHLEVGGGWNDLFHICQFAEIMEQNGSRVIPLRSALPEKCFSVLPSTGELIAIEKGCRGYAPSSMNVPGKSPRETADAANRAMGVSRAQEAAMLAGSMFGWAVPAADPANYNREGLPVRSKRKNMQER